MSAHRGDDAPHTAEGMQLAAACFVSTLAMLGLVASLTLAHLGVL